MEALRPGHALSPLFHYYVTSEHGADADGRLYLDKGLDTLEYKGICRHKYYPEPLTMNALEIEPSEEAYEDAKSHMLKRPSGNPFMRPFEKCVQNNRVDWICNQLRQNRPVVMGFWLPESYPNMLRDDTWNDSNIKKQCGGHCVLVLGYDDARQALRIQDSRGGNMFDGGRWWMGYKVAESKDIVIEAYSLIS
jgi:hypothetical protein